MVERREDLAEEGGGRELGEENGGGTVFKKIRGR